MEKGFESWFRNQQIDWQSPDPNPSSAPIGFRPRVTAPSFGNTLSPSGWFYGCRQGVNNMPKEQLPVVNPNEVQKKFLVFDQSGDQTTLIYSSGVGTAPIRYHFPSSNNPKQQSGSNPFQANEYNIKENDDDDDDSRNEMREDTEELNALLYSDDDCSENEETSTGHSPSWMTRFVGEKRVRESGEKEEVASSAGPMKRCRREDRGDIVNSLEDTASSGNGGNGVFEEEADNKRLRKEKMKETINLLQDLIPGNKNGKNAHALTVIDEAIHYLRSLKVKAKALGLDSL